MPLFNDLKINTEDFSAENINFHPPTGISVLVVGAGIGGIVAALECKRKGHDVRVIERTPAPNTAGKSSQLCMCWESITDETTQEISSPLAPTPFGTSRSTGLDWPR